eukprot:g1823.t1 g1823   contig11:135361-136474(+)
MSFTATSQNKQQSFPLKLYNVLQSTCELDSSRVISWLDHGRAFRLHDEKKFMEMVAETGIFRSTKLRSFTRQLNLWGFRRIQSATTQNSSTWYHKLFLRGDPFDTIQHMIRIKIKTGSNIDDGNHKDEPDFDVMPPLCGAQSWKEMDSDRKEKAALKKPPLVSPIRVSAKSNEGCVRNYLFMPPLPPIIHYDTLSRQIVTTSFDACPVSPVADTNHGSIRNGTMSPLPLDGQHSGMPDASSYLDNDTQQSLLDFFRDPSSAQQSGMNAIQQPQPMIGVPSTTSILSPRPFPITTTSSSTSSATSDETDFNECDEFSQFIDDMIHPV